MAALTIRNLDDGVKQRLRVRAARNGVSMEQEARLIITREVLADDGPSITGRSWYRSVRELVEPHGGFEIDVPPRSTSMRDAPTFE